MNAYGNISKGAWFSFVSGRYVGMLVFKGTFRHDGHVSQWDLLHFGVWTLKFATRESESKHPRIESIQRMYSWVLVDHLIWLSWCSDASWCYHSPNLFETFWRWEKMLKERIKNVLILLMEEILHHLLSMKTYEKWDILQLVDILMRHFDPAGCG